MFELILTLCGGWASGVWTGQPGVCMSTYQEVVVERAGGPSTSFRTFAACEREYQRQVRLGRQTYVYVGFFFDRRINVNRVRGGVCEKVG